MSKQHTHHHHHTKKHTPPKKHHKGKGKHKPSAPTLGQIMHHGGFGQPGPPSSAHTKAKHHKHTKAHKLALGDAVACCAAEALAATLRLAGQSVTDDQVLELYWLTGALDEDAGAPLALTLAAAAEHGLAGFRPVYQEIYRNPPKTVNPCTGLILGVELPGPHAIAVDHRGGWWSWGRRWDPAAFPAAVLEEVWAVNWS